MTGCCCPDHGKGAAEVPELVPELGPTDPGVARADIVLTLTDGSQITLTATGERMRHVVTWTPRNDPMQLWGYRSRTPPLADPTLVLRLADVHEWRVTLPGHLTPGDATCPTTSH